MPLKAAIPWSNSVGFNFIILYSLLAKYCCSFIFNIPSRDRSRKVTSELVPRTIESVTTANTYISYYSIESDPSPRPMTESAVRNMLKDDEKTRNNMIARRFLSIVLTS